MIKFTVNGTVYTFDANTLTLTHDTTSVTLTVDEGDEEPFVLEGTWNGVLNTENVYFQGKPIVLTFDGSGNVSMTVNELSYTGKYTFENNEITTSGWSDPGYVVDEITITIVNGELSVSLTLSQDDYPMPEFTATLTKQGGGEEEPSSPVVGSWTGTLEGIQVLKGQPVEIVFDATSVTITLNGLITFKGSYTYSETDGIKCGDDFTEGAFTLESLSLKLENGELSLTISIDDGEGPYNYTSTLTK